MILCARTLPGGTGCRRVRTTRGNNDAGARLLGESDVWIDRSEGLVGVSRAAEPATSMPSPPIQVASKGRTTIPEPRRNSFLRYVTDKRCRRAKGDDVVLSGRHLKDAAGSTAGRSRQFRPWCEWPFQFRRCDVSLASTGPSVS